MVHRKGNVKEKRGDENDSISQKLTGRAKRREKDTRRVIDRLTDLGES